MESVPAYKLIRDPQWPCRRRQCQLLTLVLEMESFCIRNAKFYKTFRLSHNLTCRCHGVDEPLLQSQELIMSIFTGNKDNAATAFSYETAKQCFRLTTCAPRHTSSYQHSAIWVFARTLRNGLHRHGGKKTGSGEIHSSEVEDYKQLFCENATTRTQVETM